jgi:hypothetical protein
VRTDPWTDLDCIAEVQQVTDAQGKRLFKPGTREIDTDPATGLMNMLPWFISDQGTSNRSLGSELLFQLGRSRGGLRVSVNSGAGGYSLTSIGGKTMMTVTARGGIGTDILTIRNPGSSEGGVTLQHQRAGTEYDVTLTRASAPRSQALVLKTSRLKIDGDGPVDVALSNAGRALPVSSARATLHYDMTLSLVSKRGVGTIARTEITQAAAASKTIQPREWQNLKGTQVIEQWRAFSAQ